MLDSLLKSASSRKLVSSRPDRPRQMQVISEPSLTRYYGKY